VIGRSLLLVPVVLAVAIVAAGCGSATKKSPSAHQTPTTETKTSGSARGASFTVGLNTDTGGLNDRGFNHLAYLGLLQAANKLGVKYKVTQSASPADYIPNLASLARAGDGLVIGVGFTEIQAVEAVAKQYPKTHFAVVDVANADEGGLKNVQGLLFKEQEVGYLAGYAAALAAKDRGAKVVSSVGGEKQPPDDRYIPGNQARATAAVPGIRTINGYAQDFTNQAKCKEVALNQIAAGSVVVFQVAGGCGLGALDAAKEKGVWGIGVDADQGYLGSWVATSALKRVDVAVYNAIQAANHG
jgi:basic membrane protein A